MNEKLLKAAAAPSDEETKRRGLLRISSRTLNHILWADGVWLSRFEGGEFPGGCHDTELSGNFNELQELRVAMDSRLTDWAARLSKDWLNAELSPTDSITPPITGDRSLPCPRNKESMWVSQISRDSFANREHLPQRPSFSSSNRPAKLLRSRTDKSKFEVGGCGPIDEAHLEKFGNEREGFSIAGDGDSLVVRAHGFWSADFSQKFVPAVMSALRASGAAARLTLDLGQLRPLRNEGQAAFKSLLIQALAAGTADLVIEAPSALTKLQMLRIVREIREQSRVRVE